MAESGQDMRFLQASKRQSPSRVCGGHTIAVEQRKAFDVTAIPIELGATRSYGSNAQADERNDMDEHD